MITIADAVLMLLTLGIEIGAIAFILVTYFKEFRDE